MKKPAETTLSPIGGPGDPQRRVIYFRLSEPDYRTLVELARYHQTTIARLISSALPRVIEKYRVLQELHKRPDDLAAGRRRG
jgi:hypothetical protein